MLTNFFEEISLRAKRSIIAKSFNPFQIHIGGVEKKRKEK